MVTYAFVSKSTYTFGPRTGTQLNFPGVVVATPTIASFTPASAAPGGTLIITGTNFTGATVVSVNSGAVAGFVVNSATQISATLTASNTSGLVRVTTPGGTAVSSTSFTITAPSTAPTIVRHLDAANTLVVAASGNGELTSNLRYSIKNGPTQAVLPSKDAQGAIPVGNAALAAGDIAVWSLNNPTQIAYNTQAFTMRPAIAQQQTQLIVVGDSITLGQWYGKLTATLPSSFLPISPNGTHPTAFGYSGFQRNAWLRSTDSAMQEKRGKLQQAIQNVGAGVRIVVIDAFGRNDCSFGVSAAQQKTDRQDLIQLVKGWGAHDVLGWTVTPTQYPDFPQPATENVRLVVNDDIRSNYTTEGYLNFIDGGGDAWMGQFESVLNGTYYDNSTNDRTHPVAAGKDKLSDQAVVICRAMQFRDLGQQTGTPGVGSGLEEDDNRISYPNGFETTTNNSNYTAGLGRYRDGLAPGTVFVSLQFNGGGFEWGFVFDTDQTYWVDGQQVMLQLTADPKRRAVYGLMGGLHTMEVRAGSGTVYCDFIIITDGQSPGKLYAQPGQTYQESARPYVTIPDSWNGAYVPGLYDGDDAKYADGGNPDAASFDGSGSVLRFTTRLNGGGGDNNNGLYSFDNGTTWTAWSGNASVGYLDWPVPVPGPYTVLIKAGAGPGGVCVVDSFKPLT